MINFYSVILVFSLVFFYENFLPKKAFAQRFKTLKIVKIKKDKNVEVWGINKNKFPITVFFQKGEKYKNCTEQDFVKRILLPPKTKKILLYTLTPQDTSNVCNAHLYWDFILGDFSQKQYDDVFFEYPYLLPFDHNNHIPISQGYFGDFSHRGLYALDFVMPQNTKVCASRSGVVLETKSDSNEGGKDLKYINKANFVKILHNDSTVAIYAHLAHNGVTVKQGQKIRRGQVIGYSGNTGYSTGAHLHFSVYSLKTKYSIPTKFQVGRFMLFLDVLEHYYRFTGENQKIMKAK